MRKIITILLFMLLFVTISSAATDPRYMDSDEVDRTIIMLHKKNMDNILSSFIVRGCSLARSLPYMLIAPDKDWLSGSFNCIYGGTIEKIGNYIYIRLIPAETPSGFKVTDYKFVEDGMYYTYYDGNNFVKMYIESPEGSQAGIQYNIQTEGADFRVVDKMIIAAKLPYVAQMMRQYLTPNEEITENRIIEFLNDIYFNFLAKDNIAISIFVHYLVDPSKVAKIKPLLFEYLQAKYNKPKVNNIKRKQK